MMCQTVICERRIYELVIWVMQVGVLQYKRPIEWHQTISFKQMPICLFRNEQLINSIVKNIYF
jgi:hypothetical protein